MKKTINTDLGPIIAKLHVLCKPTGIFGPIFEKDNCDKFIVYSRGLNLILFDFFGICKDTNI
jgi:hypothetical protein